MRLQAVERETTINTNAGENVAYIHSREAKMWRHFQRLGVKPKEEHKDNNGEIYACDYEVPKSWVKLPKPPKRMKFTVEQKAAAADRLKRGRIKAQIG